jgi:uncharacterized 2Fe-2S/4Fe-4S cluster protein (DUF4445 family)
VNFPVRFEPSGTTVETGAGRTLLEAARDAGIILGATCGGRGTCGKCQARIAEGPLPPPTLQEKRLLGDAALARGIRLACTCAVNAPLTVETLQVRSSAKGEAPPAVRAEPVSPAVRRYTVDLAAPTLEDPMDDAGRLSAALEKAGAGPLTGIDYTAARRLPAALREAGWHVTAQVRGTELIGVRPAAPALPPLGLAVDLGTTNIAAYLHRMDDGALLEVFSAANPLSSFGADIITRLAWGGLCPGNGAKMQRILSKTLNLLAEQAAALQGCQARDIEEMVVVGNSGMHHLFLDLPGRDLIRAPFVPAVRAALSVKARDLGIGICPGGYVHMPPLIGGFVGSDLLSVALSARLDREPGVRLAVDIGTNTEVLLSVNGRLSCCSTASGPALEGAALRYGMVAGPGAVDRVWVEGAGPAAALAFTTIGGLPAAGICGSGIVDALCCLRRTGVINATGRIQADSPRVIADPAGDHRCVLVPAARTALGEDITISQAEVRSLQLAKGAIRAGMDTLLALNGLEPESVEEILVAGTFGNHLGVESSVEIGLLPRIPRERIRQVGNTAGVGAGLMLLSTVEREAAAALARSIGHVELSQQQGFRRRFARSQWFPEESS